LLLLFFFFKFAFRRCCSLKEVLRFIVYYLPRRRFRKRHLIHLRDDDFIIITLKSFALRFFLVWCIKFAEKQSWLFIIEEFVLSSSYFAALYINIHRAYLFYKHF